MNVQLSGLSSLPAAQKLSPVLTVDSICIYSRLLILTADSGWMTHLSLQRSAELLAIIGERKTSIEMDICRMTAPVTQSLQIPSGSFALHELRTSGYPGSATSHACTSCSPLILVGRAKNGGSDVEYRDCFLEGYQCPSCTKLDILRL